MATNIEKYVFSLVVPVQDIENAGQQVLLFTSIDTAVGVQLDVLGRLVGQARDGLDDETYRRYIRARVSANKSKGRIEDLITVTNLVVFDEDALIKVTQEGTATARLFVTDIAVTNDLADIIFAFALDTKSAGVRIVVEWSTVPVSQTLTFDLGPGWDVGKLANSLG